MSILFSDLVFFSDLVSETNLTMKGEDDFMECSLPGEPQRSSCGSLTAHRTRSTFSDLVAECNRSRSGVVFSLIASILMSNGRAGVELV